MSAPASTFLECPTWRLRLSGRSYLLEFSRLREQIKAKQKNSAYRGPDCMLSVCAPVQETVERICPDTRDWIQALSEFSGAKYASYNNCLKSIHRREGKREERRKKKE